MLQILLAIQQTPVMVLVPRLCVDDREILWLREGLMNRTTKRSVLASIEGSHPS